MRCSRKPSEPGGPQQGPEGPAPRWAPEGPLVRAPWGAPTLRLLLLLQALMLLLPLRTPCGGRRPTREAPLEVVEVMQGGPSEYIETGGPRGDTQSRFAVAVAAGEKT